MDFINTIPGKGAKIISVKNEQTSVKEEKTGCVSVVNAAKFIYTNKGFDKDSFEGFKMYLNSVVGGPCSVFVSDSWSYKPMISNASFEKFDFGDVSNWQKSVFFNFSFEEIAPHLEKIKWLAGNFVNETNIEIFDHCRRESHIDTQITFSPNVFRTVVQPYYISIDKGRFTIIGAFSADKMYSSFLIDSSVEDYLIGELKKCMQMAYSKKCGEIFMMYDTLTIAYGLSKIAIEEEIIQRLFNLGHVVYLSYRPTITYPMTIAKFIKFELFRHRRGGFRMWVPYLHISSFLTPSTYLSLSAICGLDINYTLTSCLDSPLNNFLIL